jgi:hypothetical protein
MVFQNDHVDNKMAKQFPICLLFAGMIVKGDKYGQFQLLNHVVPIMSTNFKCVDVHSSDY